MLEGKGSGVKQELGKQLIIISNTCLDGFREGDGDLMDKLFVCFNKTDFHAVRIVADKKAVPESRKQEVRVITLSDEIPDELQNQFKRFLNGQTSSSQTRTVMKALQKLFLDEIEKQQKIFSKVLLYIGSRFDVAREGKKGVTLRGSGSLFTQNFIQQIKEHGVQVVVCCLEFKFFCRSQDHLSKFSLMLEQQLSEADGIHFLTKPDLETFKQMRFSLRNVESLQKTSTEEGERKEPDSTTTIGLSEKVYQKLSEEVRQKLLSKKVIKHIPGIYTISPFSKKKDLAELVMRPPNIFCFGLIRKNKGLEEAVELAKLFQSASSFDQKGKEKKEEKNREVFQKCNNKVIIAGKAMGKDSYYVFQWMMCRIFFDECVDDFPKKQEARKALREVQNLIKKQIKELLQAKKEGASLELEEDIAVFLRKAFLSLNDEEMNCCYNSVYTILCEKATFKANRFIEIYFNASEEKIHELAEQCRYAIKLDHKGMADNASTIVSCLGLYLPTFTTGGLMIDDYFNPEGKYGQTVILVQDEPAFDEREKKKDSTKFLKQIDVSTLFRTLFIKNFAPFQIPWATNNRLLNVA
jgi:hypothetical protein